MATVTCVHHLEQPFLGHAEGPLRRAGMTLDERYPTLGEPLPALGDVDGIISFGGGQSVLDLEHDPALQAEARLLGDAVAAGVPALGVCLGGQLLAHALGAQIRRAPRRTVAWVRLDARPAAAGDPLFSGLGSPVAALHWNEDAFTLPAGATELLAGASPGVAAFRAGERAWGVQFHPEVDAAALEGWYANYGAWLEQAGVDEARARAADARHLPGQMKTAERLFGAFARVVGEFAAARP
ncbi:MAG: type 1 glutamine amidotransferase [Solirubrobacteraceae bacterium]